MITLPKEAWAEAMLHKAIATEKQISLFFMLQIYSAKIDEHN
jgi:hypothetical protein